MTSIHIKSMLTAAALSCAVTPVMAQDTLRALNGQGQNETRAMLNLAIPFGGQREESKPQLELKLQNMNMQQDIVPLSFVPLRDRITRETRIGFTLTEKPVLMFNGEKFEPASDQSNISAGAGIAIGVLVSVGAVLILASDVRDSFSDINNPD